MLVRLTNICLHLLVWCAHFVFVFFSIKGHMHFFFCKVQSLTQFSKTAVDWVENSNSFSVFAITRNISMFEKVVVLSIIKIPHLKVNSLLLVSKELCPKDPHFAQRLLPVRQNTKIPCAILELYRHNSGIVPQSENSYFAQDNSGIVPILTLRRTYIPISNRSRNRESVVSVRYFLQMTSSNACMWRKKLWRWRVFLGIFVFEKTEKIFFHYVHSYVTKQNY